MYARLTATKYVRVVTVKEKGRPAFKRSEIHVNLSGPCVITGERYSVRVRRDAFDRWRQGELIQDAMPELSREDREFLINGISPEGWNQAFGDE